MYDQCQYPVRFPPRQDIHCKICNLYSNIIHDFCCIYISVIRKYRRIIPQTSIAFILISYSAKTVAYVFLKKRHCISSNPHDLRSRLKAGPAKLLWYDPVFPAEQISQITKIREITAQFFIRKNISTIVSCYHFLTSSNWILFLFQFV